MGLPNYFSSYYRKVNLKDCIHWKYLLMNVKKTHCNIRSEDRNDVIEFNKVTISFLT